MFKCEGNSNIKLRTWLHSKVVISVIWYIVWEREVIIPVFLLWISFILPWCTSNSSLLVLNITIDSVINYNFLLVIILITHLNSYITSYHAIIQLYRSLEKSQMTFELFCLKLNLINHDEKLRRVCYLRIGSYFSSFTLWIWLLQFFINKSLFHIELSCLN